jgi:hypothetical protein
VVVLLLLAPFVCQVRRCIADAMKVTIGFPEGLGEERGYGG